MTDMVSVVIPCYNVAPYIAQTVLSIRKQTYPALEIILVDDGSRDGTGEILDRLAGQDDRIRVLHQENAGVTAARLNGVRASSGQWIGFVDGDDFIEPDMIERLLRNAQEHQADISHCGYQMVFPDRVDLYYGTGRMVMQDRTAGLRDLISGTFVEPGLCNKLFRRNLFDVLLNDRVMDMTVRNTEDLLMNYYLFSQAQRSYYEDFCPYHYQVRKNSAATGKININKLTDPLKVLKLIRADLSDEQAITVAEQRITACLIGLATMRIGQEPALVGPVRKQARAELRSRLRIGMQYASTNQKIRIIWVCIWPASYGWVHWLHAKARGLDRKYEVR